MDSTNSLNLEKNPVVYVTRDLERALGLPLDTLGYFIISNSTPFAKALAQSQPNVRLIESTELLDTHKLLAHSQTIDFIAKISNPHILVFKNTTSIEKMCAEKNWPLLNPPAALANTVEEKISQVAWLDELTQFLPPHRINLLKEIVFDGTAFVLQFNHGHTGSGTILIDEEKKLDELKQKFPERSVRVTAYVEGTMLTSNNVVTLRDILVGNISCQITGLAPFTDQPFTTVGNDWALPKKFLTVDQGGKYAEIVTAVGAKLHESGWRGLFGTDILVEEKTGELFLIEINARQPASTTYESQLQARQNAEEDQMTTFAAHLASLLPMDLSSAHLIPITDGAQIIVRNQEQEKFSVQELKTISEKLSAAHFNVINYTNTAPGSDVLRVQSTSGIMEHPTQFNKVGEKINSLLKLYV